MDYAEFKRFVGSIDLLNPSKTLLWEILEKELDRLWPSQIERLRVYGAFDISFEGHRNLKPRESGEAYFFHPFRAAIRKIRRQVALGIKDIQVIVDTLLHDCFEEAANAGINPILMHSEVHIRMGTDVAEDVHCLTKQKQLGETNLEYLVRLLKCGRWRPIAAKLEDRYDNLITLESMPLPNQVAKLEETARWLSLLTQELSTLIEYEVSNFRLSGKFQLLVPSLAHDLQEEIKKQKARLGLT